MVCTARIYNIILTLPFILQGVDRPHYDVVCVGAGPAGACLGYYMGKKGRKVLLLDKATFPRDKICGDALCKTGIEIIHEMGVYEELMKENKCNIVSNCDFYFAVVKVNVCDGQL